MTMLGPAVVKNLWTPMKAVWSPTKEGAVSVFFEDEDAEDPHDQDIPHQRYVYTRDMIRKSWTEKVGYNRFAAMRFDTGSVVFQNVSEEEALHIAAVFVRIFSHAGLDRTIYDPEQNLLVIYTSSMIQHDLEAAWDAYVVTYIPRLLKLRPKDVPVFADDYKKEEKR